MKWTPTILLSSVAVVAVGVWCMDPGRTSDDVRAGIQPAPTKTEREAAGPGSAVMEGGDRRPGRFRIVRMAGEDWLRYFRESSEGQSVGREFQEEIVALAEELQEERLQGLDVASPEVLAYTETIRLLLAEGSREEEDEPVWR